MEICHVFLLPIFKDTYDQNGIEAKLLSPLKPRTSP